MPESMIEFLEACPMFFLIELDVSAYDRKVLIAWQTNGVPCRSVVGSREREETDTRFELD